MRNDWRDIKTGKMPKANRLLWVTKTDGSVEMVSKTHIQYFAEYHKQWGVIAWKYREPKPQPYVRPESKGDEK